jgi:hypothetical protein
MEFGKQTLWLVVLLYLATGGSYGVYWIARNGYVVNAPGARRSATILTSLMLGALCVTVLAVGYAMRMVALHKGPGLVPHFGEVFALGGVSTILMYIFAAIVSGLIAARIRACSMQQSGQACSPTTAVVLTVLGFTSAIYLQYHINRLH